MVLTRLGIALTLAASLSAQTLIKDINQTPKLPDGDSNPSEFAVAGPRVFFKASRPDSGTELYVTDGTVNGTRLLQDIRPGPFSSDPRSLIAAGTDLYFSATDGTHGRELWHVDNQLRVTMFDLRPGSASSTPAEITAIGDRVYFAATHDRLGRELWMSEGTTATTRVASDIVGGVFSSNPGGLTRHRTALFFAAHSTGFGRELWRVTGVVPRAVQMADIRRGGSSSNPDWITSSSFGVYFTADDGASGRELWFSSGTGAATRRVLDMRPGPASSTPRELTSVGSDLFYTAYKPETGRELYRATTRSAVLVRDIYPGSRSSTPVELTAFGSALYFSAATPTRGREMWKATRSGANQLLDLVPGTGSSYPRHLTPVGTKLFFRADGSRGGDRIWVTSGSTSSTHIVTDTAADGRPDHLTAWGSKLIYANTDPRKGREPHVANANGEGVINVGRFVTEASSPHDFHDFNGLAVFAADDGLHGQEPWRSDGTTAGTFRLADIARGSHSSDPRFFGTVGDWYLFSARSPSHGRELWRTDGTAAGTTLVKDISPGTGSGVERGGVVVGDTLLFVGRSPGLGWELWRSDGTASGTRLVKDIHPGVGGSIFDVAPLGDDEVLLFADHPTYGREPWRSDGTAEGTVLIKDTIAGPRGASSATPRWATAGSRTVFVWFHPAYGEELWSTNGLATSTFAIDLTAGHGSSSPQHLSTCGDFTFFQFLRELWRTDGTPQGTFRVYRDRAPKPWDRACSGGTLYFRGADGEPWFSKLVIGTRRIADLWTGGEAMDSSEAAPGIGALGSGGKAVLRARRSTDDYELWITDGTATGTRLRMDIRKGPLGSRPRMMTTIGDKLFFAADDGIRGHELWVMPLASVGAGSLGIYNAGCRGSSGTPLFVMTEPPGIGRPFTASVRNARPNTAAVFTLGQTRQSIPAGGCRLLNELLWTASARTDGDGKTRLALPIPNTKEWLGTSIYLQSVVYDPGARFLGTFALSAGMQAVVGR